MAYNVSLGLKVLTWAKNIGVGLKIFTWNQKYLIRV